MLYTKMQTVLYYNHVVNIFNLQQNFVNFNSLMIVRPEIKANTRSDSSRHAAK